MTSMRPDEYARESAIEKSQAQDKRLKKGLKTAAGLGLAAAAPHLSGLASKVSPFLSSYIPVDLAMKGINKISPQLGSFLKRGMEEGLDVKEGLNYIKDNIGLSGGAGLEAVAKEARNIIQQYSPELFSFMENGIKQGRSPVEVAAIAQNNKDFGKVIKKMQQDHKTNWSDIVQSIFGNGQTAQPQQAQQQQTQGMGQPQQGQQQSGPGQQRMLNILQKINQRLGLGQ